MPTKLQRKTPVKKATTAALEISSERPRRRGRGVRAKVLSQFTIQLATLQSAGLPIVKCLRILERQMRAGPFRESVGLVADDVESGNSLSEALAKHPQNFDRLYVNMVRAGEAGGVLDGILLRLADFSEKAEEIKSKIRNALAYPIFVVVFACAIVAFIMAVVVPKFITVFAEFDVKLPPPTRLLMAVSHSFAAYWFLILGIPVLLVVLLRVALRHPAVRYRFDGLKLAVPLVGNLIRKTIVARFARTLGTLLQSGVPILEALAILRGAVANAVLEAAVDRVHDNIREGEPIARPLGECGIFDEIVVNMVDVGERTGELDKMLLKVADAYEREVDARVTALFKLIEPALLLVLALVVGFIVVSLFLPIIKIMDTFADRGV
ncbi:MAG: type II secretion system F family protein [Planctomycetota bacterium]